MQNYLFFEGPVRIGKSTYLRDEINRKTTDVCGFTVQRILRDGQIVGYQAAAVNRLPLPPVNVIYSPELTGIFLLDGKKDISVLERVILETEHMVRHDSPALVVMDEIGGMELASEAFMKSLLSILKSGIPCIGILKSTENLAHTVSMLRLHKNYIKKREELARLIRENGIIIPVNTDNLERIAAKSAAF